jgi:rfaE bifunctional protein nucleotidyltransferase chain/domain
LESLQIIKNKIITKDQLGLVLAKWNLKNEKIVFTNGCFDILHQGHVDYLSKASDKGSKLIVAVNSDSSVKKLNKGANRPLQDEFSRAILIASLQFVDQVIIFEEETPFELISVIKPNILVKGSDYSIDKIVGADIVLNNEGKVETIDFLKGYSTSLIVEKAKQ